MINKRIGFSKKNFLLLLYLVILALIGPAIYWLNEGQNSGTGIKTTENKFLRERISVGNNILITADKNVLKKEASEAFAKGNYDAAATKYAAALRLDSNDPEALIYLNNAIAIASDNTYKIGVSVPIGGNLDVAKEILRGVAQAQNEINQVGGIKGSQVIIEIANDDNDPEIAEQVAENFVKDDAILAVIGHNDSNASVAAAPIYQQKGLVMITPTSSADIIPTMGTYIFRTTPNTRALASTLANYVIEEENITKIAVCTDSQSEVSKSFKEEFIWSIYKSGGKIVPTKCNFSGADFLPSRVLSHAISDGAEAILLAPSVQRVNKAVEVARANEDRLALFGTHGMVSYDTLKQGQTAVNGMVLVVAWHPTPETKVAFEEDAIDLWGGLVGWRTAMAYDAAKTLFAGLTLGSDRDQLQQVLANREFSAEGASETINFLPSGDRNMPGQLVQIQPGGKSGTGFDFVTLENPEN